jgi:hypothetical protein
MLQGSGSGSRNIGPVCVARGHLLHGQVEVGGPEGGLAARHDEVVEGAAGHLVWCSRQRRTTSPSTKLQFMASLCGPTLRAPRRLQRGPSGGGREALHRIADRSWSRLHPVHFH